MRSVVRKREVHRGTTFAPAYQALDYSTTLANLLFFIEKVVSYLGIIGGNLSVGSRDDVIRSIQLHLLPPERFENIFSPVMK